MMNQKLIQLSEIVTDAGTQVRVQPDDATVADYAQHMTDGAQFPPVVLFHDGNQYFLADGFHRVLAARRNDWRDIEADVHVGTKTDALWFALAANKANGRRLTEADKKHAVMLAFGAWPDRSQRDIADQIGCAQSYVQKLRGEYQVNTGVHLPDRVVGRDGKSYPSTPDAVARTRERAAEMFKSGKSVDDVRQATGIGRDAASRVKREAVGGVDKSRESVAQRRKDIADMAARGFTTRQMEATLGLSGDRIATIAKAEGIVIHADRVVAGTRRIDANRVVEQTVMDAENLTEGVDLIALNELDPEKLGAWIESLKNAHRALGEFVKRLIKEQSKHGQAA